MATNGEICALHYQTREPVRVRWADGKIATVEPCPTPSQEIWIAPALVDLQVNGYGGIDFQQDDLTVEDLLVATRQLRAAGCTRFLLTLITDEWSKLTRRLRHIRSLRAQSAELQAAIVGWHVEGPFLSSEPGFHGAHNPAFMLDPMPEHILELRTITASDPLLLTIAPERSGAIDAIALATRNGIRVSLGHTNAPLEILQQAVGAGATGFTHLGNGCPRELDRHDNIVWRVFETPGLMPSLIPDRIHVSPALFRLIHKTLGSSIYYTTDSMSAAGAPPGRYKLGVMELEVGADQIVRQPGKSNFAGSALRPIDAIFRAAEMLDRPWQQTWDHYAINPATIMGLGAGLRTGDPADFCLIRSAQNRLLELNVQAA